jgi:hypothetical protein
MLGIRPNFSYGAAGMAVRAEAFGMSDSLLAVK